MKFKKLHWKQGMTTLIHKNGSAKIWDSWKKNERTYCNMNMKIYYSLEICQNWSFLGIA